ncbi:EamA family transporter [Danxiaibacter flavus]|uniref:EamA family transporter n=1 Tax=Danxiaibacter flavus TaxID=3049108 RepID=A0ABV3Z7V2_9BACT|nr:EamA family transporter [Chitinophagaceae bacterium DXS]
MTDAKQKHASPLMVVVAFATVYLVWGSTYFFIQRAVSHIPPFLIGAMRFLAAGIIMLTWCALRGEKIFNPQQIRPAVISGLLLLLIGNGTVIWAEQTLPSSLVAVLVSSAPIWFVLLDKPKWKENFTSKSTLTGLFIGFAGVILLFSEQTGKALSGGGGIMRIVGLIAIVLSSMSWAGGSLYSKYNGKGSASINTGWQMLSAGIAFVPISLLSGEWQSFQWQTVPASSWLSVVYLIFMGSLAGYSAYVWLLQVRPATQVSTYAYVNPVVAVLLGVFFANEHMTVTQILGLAIILTSVLLINLAKYRKEKQTVVTDEKISVTRKIIVANTGAVNCDN